MQFTETDKQSVYKLGVYQPSTDIWFGYEFKEGVLTDKIIISGIIVKQIRKEVVKILYYFRQTDALILCPCICINKGLDKLYGNKLRLFQKVKEMKYPLFLYNIYICTTCKTVLTTKKKN